LNGVQFFEILLAAIVAGAFGAMLGLGGGIILVPAMIAVLDVPRTTAVAASLVSIVATSGAASLTYLRDRYVDLRVAAPLEFATSVGALFGAIVAYGLAGLSGDGKRLTDAAFAGAFAAVLVYAAISVVRRGRTSPRVDQADEPSAFQGDYIDRRTGECVRYGVRRQRDGMVAGFFAGNVSALLGVGGGLIMVPVMVSRMGLPIKIAVGTSSLIIGSTAAATSIPYLAAGWVHPYYAVTCTLGVLVGGRLGARVSQRTSAARLSWVFAAVLVYTASTMAMKALALLEGR
jgi:uncharacterized membrane protein YfcA